MKRKYWDIYYNKKKKLFRPSNFSRFIGKKKFLNKKSIILEIGCGDGRDSFYFSKIAKKVFSVDSSSEIIRKNNLYKIENNIQNIKFFCINIGIKKQFKATIKKNNFDFVYARFFLHAIDYKSEKLLFKNFALLPKNVIFFFEFRTIKDELINLGRKISKYERITSHYRRFINTDDFTKMLKKMHYKILYYSERKGLSKFNNEDPHLCRIFFKKK
tara:strand:- start:230 stop:874 length:645 start_codon:yes stop_codon:yes gene_type:complete